MTLVPLLLVALATTGLLDADPALVVVLGLLLLGGGGAVVARRARRSRGGDGDHPGGGDDRDGTGTALLDREPGTERPEDDRGDDGGAGAVTDELELPKVPDTPAELLEPEVVEPEVIEPEVIEPEPLTLRERFRQRLTRTRNVLGASVVELFGGGVTEEAWEGLEEALITADVGVTATMEIVEELRRRAREEGATSGEAVLELLKEELRAALGTPDRTLARATDDGPTVWLVTGVNGTGKTTTIGKLAAVEARAGHRLTLAAADTFRAAAAEQLGIWAERTGAELVRKEEGADPASVAYESYDAAVSKGSDLLIVDTAGRLHNKRQLMDELGKVKRVLEKQAGPLEETLLVLDATTGQNGIAQAQAFLEAVEVTGIALTKLDGSSKGGIVVAVQRELGIPVKLVGLGEELDDLAPFDPELFVEGLFAEL
ncbi:MAG: signal recognition particle-docking protein FtsY [Nitriliruptor sp.]|nr:MAG: signal recognition particle-docking protein FtsY [Nitriliruptor sp.]